MRNTLLTSRKVIFAILLAFTVCCLTIALVLSGQSNATASAQTYICDDEIVYDEVGDAATFVEKWNGSATGIKLTADITLSSTDNLSSLNRTLTLDLNDCMLDLDSRYLTLVTDGTLTLVDNAASKTTRNDVQGYNASSSESDVSVTGGYITGAASYGIYINSGTLNMESGNIVGIYGNAVFITSRGIFNMFDGNICYNCSSNNAGGTVSATYGTFTMYGGSISYNYFYCPRTVTGTYGGGGVFCTNLAYFTMKGGEITHNVSERHGGGVMLSWTTVLNVRIEDGDISYNKAASYGGAIFAFNGSLILSGGTITHNESAYGAINCDALTIERNSAIVVDKNPLTGGGVGNLNTDSITIKGKLVSGSCICMSTDKKQEFQLTSGFEAYGNSESGASCFYADVGGIYYKNGELYFNPSSSAHIHRYTQWLSTSDGKRHVGYCATEDANISHDAQWVCSNSTDTQHTFTCTAGDGCDLTRTEAHTWQVTVWYWKSLDITSAQERANNYMKVDLKCESCHAVQLDAQATVETKDVQVISSPNCTEFGRQKVSVVLTYQGQSFSNEQEQTSQALGHVWKLSTLQEPTCLQPGSITHWQCTRCAKYFDTNEDNFATGGYNDETKYATSATGHVFDTAHEIGAVAQCTEKGMTAHWYCKKCNQCFAANSKNDSTDAKTHASFETATSEHNVDGDGVCRVCGRLGEAAQIQLEEMLFRVATAQIMIEEKMQGMERFSEQYLKLQRLLSDFNAAKKSFDEFYSNNGGDHDTTRAKLHALNKAIDAVLAVDFGGVANVTPSADVDFTPAIIPVITALILLVALIVFCILRELPKMFKKSL